MSDDSEVDFVKIGVRELAAARAEIERLTAKLQARDGECAAKAQIIAQLEAERDEAIVLMDRAGEALKKSAQRREELTAERDEAQTDLGKVILALPTGTGERAAGPVEGVKTMRKRLEAERDEALHNLGLATASIDRLNENNQALAEDLNEALAQVARLSDIADTIDRCFADNETGESRLLIDGEWHSGHVAAECERIIKAIRDLIRMRAGSPSAALEAYGREKVREGMRRAIDLAMQPNDDHGMMFAEAYEFRDIILAEMETLE